MSLTDLDLLSVLRSGDPIETLCRRIGLPQAEFEAARDAFLKTCAAAKSGRLTGAVSGTVEIKRDRAGVPHVYADTSADLFFGLGVAMSQDRLWQMDRLRRRALGRQAEVLGREYAASDAAHLTVGIDRISMADAAMMDDATHALVAAFVAGINRYIEVAGTDLPIEFRLLNYAPEPFSVRDIVAIGRGIWWSLNGRIDRLAAAECARLLPDDAIRTLFLTPEAAENLVAPWATPSAALNAAGTDDTSGSNNWALNGTRTGTGRPIMCGDPHQPFWVPSTWYEFALHGPEDNAAGATHAGLPGLWWGSNGTVAWSITNNAASTRDLYREEIDPGDPQRYRDGDTWRRFDERTADIQVRGEPTRPLTIRSTVRGPIVNALLTPVTEGGDPPLSLRWVGAEHIDDLKAMIAVPRARDWPSFQMALRDWAVAVFNFVYADASGNIGYQMAGRIPIRGRFTYGFRDANTASDRWDGYIPFEELPSGFNPRRGYVASANQRIVSSDYQYPIYGAYSQGHRGVRIDEVIASHSAMSRDANVAFQNDVKNCRASRLCPHILRHLSESGDHSVSPISNALSGWDYHYNLSSVGATVFEAFMALWQRQVLLRHLPARLLDLASQQTGLAASLLEGEQPGYFPERIGKAVVDVAKQTVGRLQEQLGDDPAAWRWERVHIVHWRHPLSTSTTSTAFDIGPAPVDGGSHTIRNTGGELPPHAASSGAEYRIVVDFTAPNHFLAVQNIGNSGVPGSPHYKDQFEPWRSGRYHVVQLERQDVEADCESATLIRADAGFDAPR